MESANLHHHHQHQFQDHQFVGSSSLSTPSFYAGVGSNNNTWNPNLILNSNNLNGNVNGGISNSKELRRHGDILVPPLSTSMVQDLGYHHWASNTCNFTNQSTHDLNLAKIKEELSDSPYKIRHTKIDDQSHSDDFHLHSPSYVKHEREPNLHNLSEKLFRKTFSSGCQLNELQGGALYSSSQSGAGFGGTDACNRGSYSQIFPRANISNLIPSSSPFLTSSGMNLQVLDLLNSTKFGGGFGQPTNNNLGLYNETPSFGLEHMQESTNWLTNSPDKSQVPSFTNGTTETKRSSTVSESKASHTAPKKARFESRSSLTPFKVRKEKLGDRIAALQQLVAPFGKTDTASVLMEAIGYIKFLQDQVETLSVPYMKSSSNNTHRSIQEDSSEDGEQETKPDLRSRGLCLVPLTCVSYITNDNLGVWPGPPNYGGGGRT